MGVSRPRHCHTDAVRTALNGETRYVVDTLHDHWYGRTFAGFGGRESPEFLEPLWAMQTFRFHFILIIVASILAGRIFDGRAAAQAPPPPLSTVVITAVELTDEQINQVKQYVAYWANLLVTSSKPEDVEKARNQLNEPLNRLSVTPSLDFRGVYSKQLLPELEKAIAGSNPHAAVNALIIASQIGTDNAMRLLLDQCDKTIQPVWQLRLQAAFGAKTMLDDSQALKFASSKTLDWAKRLRDASRNEESSHVMRHQFAAIGAADHNGLKTTERKQVRDYLLESLVNTVARAERANNNPHHSPLIEAAGSAVGVVRDKFLDNSLTKPEKETLGRDSAAVLVRLLAVVNTTWQASQADDHAKRTMSYIVGACEGYLTRIDATLKGEGKELKTHLRESWDTGRKDGFDADLKQWQDAVAKPPYTK